MSVNLKLNNLSTSAVLMVTVSNALIYLSRTVINALPLIPSFPREVFQFSYLVIGMYIFHFLTRLEKI